MGIALYLCFLDFSLGIYSWALLEALTTVAAFKV